MCICLARGVAQETAFLLVRTWSFLSFSSLLWSCKALQSVRPRRLNVWISYFAHPICLFLSFSTLPLFLFLSAAAASTTTTTTMQGMWKRMTRPKRTNRSGDGWMNELFWCLFLFLPLFWWFILSYSRSLRTSTHIYSERVFSKRSSDFLW